MGMEPLTEVEGIVYPILITFLVIFAGITAGLTVGLFSLDTLYLRVQAASGTDAKRKQAKRILRVLSLQHWTLLSLILVNASAMMTLPIVLERVFDQVTALCVSVTAVLFLGEVIPLSTFMRWALPICSFFVPVAWFAVVVTAPISYPVGKLLDILLGHKDEIMDKEELAAVLLNQYEVPAQCRLTEAETRALQGAMALSTTRVKDGLRVPLDHVFMISSTTPLDPRTIENILVAGFSRVPVYCQENRRHILGCLIVHSLLDLCFTNPEKPPLAGDYPIREVLRVSLETSMYDVYTAFQTGQSYMAVVYDSKGQMCGIITLGDVLAYLHHDPNADGSHFTHRRNERMANVLTAIKSMSSSTARIGKVAQSGTQSGNTSAVPSTRNFHSQMMPPPPTTAPIPSVVDIGPASPHLNAL